MSARDTRIARTTFRISTRAATLLHSATYDAHCLGSATDPLAVPELYHALSGSRQALCAYISELELKLGIPQHEFTRFD